jgi:protein-arginine kinase activator protein McsA
MTKHLWYYTCRHCATWAASHVDAGTHVRCNGCGGSKKSEFRVAVNDPVAEEIWAYSKRNGIAHLPLPDTSPKACARCGETFEAKHLRARMGQIVCKGCYEAEERPYESSLTREDLDRMEREMFARHEAAYGTSGE